MESKPLHHKHCQCLITGYVCYSGARVKVTGIVLTISPFSPFSPGTPVGPGEPVAPCMYAH